MPFLELLESDGSLFFQQADIGLPKHVVFTMIAIAMMSLPELLLLLLFLGVLIAITVDIVIVVKKRSANADAGKTAAPTPPAQPKDHS